MSEYYTPYPVALHLQTIGRYRTIRRIGRGSMGMVWLCEDPRLKRQVAIKTLPAQEQQNHKFAQRLEREVRAIAALVHPHIVSIYDYGQQPLPDGTVMTYLVMPYVDGGSLATQLSSYRQQGRRMPAHEAFHWLGQAAEAIDYAHQQQIIHCNLKPANMLLRDERWLLLTDFGIARIASQMDHLSRAGLYIGTPEYLAPEQIRGQGTLTSDTYSLAVLAYQMFTGRVPFQEETAIAVMLQQLHETPPSPQHFDPALNTPFATTLLQGLHKDPRQRPALASEFIAQLERAYHDATYQPIAMRTSQEIPAFASIEDISTVHINQHQQVPIASSSAQRNVSRRHLLFGTGVAAATLIGTGLGTWSLAHSLADASPAIPPQPTSSARPRRTGADLPALVLTGHSMAAAYLCWTSNSQMLISSASDGQVLRWNIPQLFQQPDRTYGTPFYSGQPLQFRSIYQFLFRGSPVMAVSSLDDTWLAVANTSVENTNAQISLYRMPDLHDKASINLTKDPSDNGGIYILSWLPNHRLMVTQNIWLPGADNGQYPTYVVDPEHPDRPTPVSGITDGHESIIGFLSPYSATSPTRAICYEKSMVIGDLITTDEARWMVRTTIQYGADTDFTASDWSANEQIIVGTLNVEHGYTSVPVPAFLPNWHTGKSDIRTLEAPETKDTNKPILICNPASTTPGVALATTLGEVFLWDLKADSAPVRKLDSGGIEGYVRALSWSPDGHWLAASIQDRHNSIVIWKL